MAASKRLQEARVAAKMPARGKLLANLERIRPEDRARAGITQEMIDASQNPEVRKGVEIVRGPWAARAEDDVTEQVRVLDHDENVVLFSGSSEQYRKLTRAVLAEEG